MRKVGNSILLSSSDLVGRLNCRHLTELDFAVANGRLGCQSIRTHSWNPSARERGARHEHRYIDHLKSKGLSISVIEGVGINKEAVSWTREAMARGAEVIVQGAFRCGEWVGRTDVLLRISTPSALGPWSYEVVDTKACARLFQLRDRPAALPIRRTGLRCAGLAA